MESLELLNMCRSYEDDMLKLRQHLELLSDMAGSLSAAGSGGGGGQGPGDRTGRFAVKLAEANEIISLRQMMHENEQLAVCHLLEGCVALEGRVLHRYYVRGDTLDNIAKKLSYSREYIRRKRREGVEKLPQNVPEGFLPKEYARWYKRYKAYEAKIIVQT